MQPSRLIRTAILLMALLVPGLGQSREASPQAAHADASPARATVALNQADQAWLSSHGQKIVAGLVPNDLPPLIWSTLKADTGASASTTSKQSGANWE